MVQNTAANHYQTFCQTLFFFRCRSSYMCIYRLDLLLIEYAKFRKKEADTQALNLNVIVKPPSFEKALKKI